MTLGQRIIDKIEGLDEHNSNIDREQKKRVLVDLIDFALAEVKALYEVALRDKFAAEVAAVSFSHEKNMVCLGAGNEKAITAIAEDAYAMADALLKARGV